MLSASPFTWDQSVRHLISHLDKICVAITGSTPAKMQANAANLLSQFPFQEFRLDYLDDPLAAVSSFREFLAEHGSACLLATCRPQAAGGRFPGSPQDELAVLLAAADAGFPLADLSLEGAEELGPDALRQLRQRGAAVLVSFHDFQCTGELQSIASRLRSLGPDLCKVVPTATNLSDSIQVLRFLRQPQDGCGALVGMAMGEAGVVSRILGPRAGSRFTFASATEAEATAPGQLTARTLTELYRIREIGPATRLFGVAGDPIHSSLSPLMLNTAFQQQELDAIYLPLKTRSAEELFRAARELPLDGFSVTMPLKQAILPFLQTTDSLAAQIGAVNTVRRDPQGNFHGDNTDVSGILVPLEQRLSLKGTRVLILGAGGAARAAAFACSGRGAQVFLYNRTEEAAVRLARDAGATVLPRAALASEDFDVLINATPAGMRGNPLRLPLEEHELRARLVFDLVYNPIETPLIALARAKSLQCIQGVEMFVQQGARQFEIWMAQTAPAEAMQRVVLEHLRSQP